MKPKRVWFIFTQINIDHLLLWHMYEFCFPEKKIYILTLKNTIIPILIFKPKTLEQYLNNLIYGSWYQLERDIVNEVIIVKYK